MEHSRISRSEIIEAADDCKQQATDLRKTIDELCHSLERVCPPVTNRLVDADLERDVRKIIRARRAREQFFDASLFADPAWDMLLDLFASDIGNQRVPVGSLCAAATVPATTALRWIRNLERSGLVRRHQDPLDGRRCFVSLTFEASLAMASYFKSIARPTVI